MIYSWKSVVIFCGNDTLALAMPFAMKKPANSDFSLPKFLASVPAIR